MARQARQPTNLSFTCHRFSGVCLPRGARADPYSGLRPNRGYGLESDRVIFLRSHRVNQLIAIESRNTILSNHAAVAHNRYGVAVLENLAQQMRNENEADTAAGGGAHEGEQLRRLMPVQRRGWFIENNKPGRGIRLGKGPRDLPHLALTNSQVLYQSGSGDTVTRENFIQLVGNP